MMAPPLGEPCTFTATIAETEHRSIESQMGGLCTLYALARREPRTGAHILEKGEPRARHSWLLHAMHFDPGSPDRGIWTLLHCTVCGKDATLTVAELKEAIAAGYVNNVAQWASCWPVFDQ